MVYLLRRSRRASPDSPARSLRSERSLNSALGSIPTPNSDKHTVSTVSSATPSSSSDNNRRRDLRYRQEEASSIRLPYLPPTRVMEEENKLLRRRVEEHQQRDEQKERTIRNLQKQLEASKENANRWKLALQGDVRPGSQYRQEIASLKEELDARDEVIQAKEEMIEHLMLSHLQYPPPIPNSLDTSVCSSLLDDAPESPPQVMKHLLSENEIYAEKLLKQEDELRRLRRERACDEQERVFLRNKVAALTLQTPSEQNEVGTRARRRSIFRSDQTASLPLGKIEGSDNDHEVDSSYTSSEPFDAKSPPRRAGQPSQMATSSASSHSNHRESSRTMKRLMELQNDLRKERDSNKLESQQLRRERDLLVNELKQVRNELWKAKLVSENVEDMAVQLEQTKFALNDSMRNAQSSNRVAKHQETAFRDMNQTIVRLQSEIRKRDAELADLKQTGKHQKDAETYLRVQQETKGLKVELDGAMVELQKASEAHVEQNKRIQNLRRDLTFRMEENFFLQQDLKVRTQSIVKPRSDVTNGGKEIEPIQFTGATQVVMSTGEIDTLRIDLKSRDEAVERLQNDLIVRTNNLVRLRNDLVEKDRIIDELLDSKIELSASVERARLARLEMQEQTAKDKEDLLKLSHEQNGRLLQKVKLQKQTITKIELDLSEKEKLIDELGKTCKEMSVALFRAHSDGTEMQNEVVEDNEDIREQMVQKESKIELPTNNLKSQQDNFKQARKILPKDETIFQFQQAPRNELSATGEQSQSEHAEIQKRIDLDGSFQIQLKPKAKEANCLYLDLESQRKHREQQVEQALCEQEGSIAELETSKKILTDSPENTLSEQSMIVEDTSDTRTLLHHRNDSNHCLQLEKELQKQKENNLQMQKRLCKKEAKIAELEAIQKTLSDTIEKSLADQSHLLKENEDARRNLQGKANERVTLSRELSLVNSDQVQIKLAGTDLKMPVLVASKIKVSDNLGCSRAGQFEVDEEKKQSRNIVSQKSEGNERLVQDLETRQASIDELRRQLGEKESQIEALETSKQNLFCEWENQSEEIGMLRNDIKMFSKENDHMRHKLQKQIEESANLHEEISARESHIESLNATKKDLKEALRTAGQKVADQGAMIEGLETASADLSEQLNSLRDDFERVTSESGRLQEAHIHDARNLKVELAKKCADVESIEQAKNELNLALETSNRAILSRDLQLEDLEEARSKYGEELTALRLKIKDAFAEIDSLKQEIDARDNLVFAARQEIVEKDLSYVALESMKKKADDALEHAHQQMSIKERMTLELETDSWKTSDEVDRLKEEIRNISSEKEALRQKVTTCTGEIAKYRQELDGKKSKVESPAEAKHELTESLQSIRTVVSERVGKIEMLQKRRGQATEKMSNLLRDLKSAHEENDRLKSDSQCNKIETVELRKLIDSQNKNVKSLDTSAELSTENERLKDDLQMHARELVKARQEILGKDSVVKSLEGVKGKMNEALELAMTERKEREELSKTRIELTTQIEVLEADLKERNEDCRCMAQEIELQAQSLSKLTNDVVAKTGELRESSLTIGMLRADKEELARKNTTLADQIKDLTCEIVDLTDEISKLKGIPQSDESSDSLKEELDQAKKSENDTVQSYERQISALTMNKDVTINTLRKDLAAARARSSEEVARLTSELSKMQEANNELERHCNNDALRKKDQQIYALERTLYAQEKTVDSLQTELDQLQFSMIKASEQRRSDIEELQKELIESQTELNKQNRECLALKMQLDECKAQREHEVERLRHEVERHRKESPLARTMKDLQKTNMLLEVRERLEHLKVKNIELKEENIKLAARLERATIKVQAIEAEKKFAAESEEECFALRRQVKELENLLENEVQTVREVAVGIRNAETLKGMGKGLVETRSADKSESSRGILGMGKLPKVKSWGRSKKIPSVLYVTLPHNTAGSTGEEKPSA